MNNKDRNSILKKAWMDSLPTMIALMGAIVFFLIVYRYKEIFSVFAKLCSVLRPIIIGVVIAYLLRPIEIKVERYLSKLYEKVRKRKLKNEKSIRMPAILLTLFFVGAIFYTLLYLVVPQLYQNISRIVYMVPGQLTNAYQELIQIVSKNPQLQGIVEKTYSYLMDFITGWVKNDMLSQFSMLVGRVFSVFGALSHFFIGIIVAIYLLLSRETFKRYFDLILRAFCSDRVSAKTREILRESDRIFGGFISGKIIDSFIIGLICFAGCLLLGFPYVVLVSVIVGVTNVIPFFGPYIGAIPSTILIMLDSPTKGLIFLVFVVLLQQFDGNILGPKILGSSTGLSPFWVIFSIILFSGFFGLIGMIIGVPAFGVIYYIAKNIIHQRIEKKERVEICEKE